MWAHSENTTGPWGGVYCMHEMWAHSENTTGSWGGVYCMHEMWAHSENTTGSWGGVYCMHEMYVSNDCMFFVCIGGQDLAGPVGQLKGTRCRTGGTHLVPIILICLHLHLSQPPPPLWVLQSPPWVLPPLPRLVWWLLAPALLHLLPVLAPLPTSPNPTTM